MFDIGFAEIVVVSLLALLVIGPKRLPDVIRTTSLWIGRLRRSFRQLKTELESELEIDEIRRELHNEDIMGNLKDSENAVNSAFTSTKESLKNAIIDDSKDSVITQTDTVSSSEDIQPAQNPTSRHQTAPTRDSPDKS